MRVLHHPDETMFGRCWAALRSARGIVAAIVVCCPVLPSIAAPPPPSRETTKIAGRLLDEQGQPVAGIEVEAFARKQRPTARSDASGRFVLEIPNGHRGSLVLRAQTADGSRQGVFQFDNLDDSSPSAKLVMRPARMVEIQVVDGQGRPVDGAAVGVTSGWNKMAEAVSDRSGHAVLRVPADASLLYVWAAKPDVGLDYFVFRWFNEPASNAYKLSPDHAQLTLTLDGTRTVMLRVFDEHGKPMSNVVVYPWYIERPKKGGDFNLSGLEDFYVTTDAQGQATFHFIPSDNTGAITFWTQLAGYYTPERPTFDPQSKSADVVARLVALSPVRGKVTFTDGRPAANAEILVRGAGYQMDNFHESIRADANGKFEIGVYPDQYVLFAAGIGEWASPVTARIVRQGQTQDDIHLVLEAGRRVHGRVTAGNDHRPVPGQQLTLYQNYAEQYLALAEEEKLPDTRGLGKSIGALLGRNAQSDANGDFEFFVPPGHYYIIGPQSIEAPKFDVTNQREVEINLHANEVEGIVLSGGVILASDPTKPVGEAIVLGVPGYVRAVTDADGAFEVERASLDMLFHARSKDGALAGIVRVAAGDRSCEIPVAATTSAAGRVVHLENGRPLVGQQVVYGVRVDIPGGGFSDHFGGRATTNEQGKFVLRGLVPDWEYTINLVLERDEQGDARHFVTAATIKANRNKIVELGDFKLKPVDPTPTVSGKITFDGQPLAKGKMVFHPDQGETVEIEVKDGAFSAAKMPLGKMKVTFEFDGVPNKYESAATTPLRVMIQKGKNQVAFDLKKE